jgi:hypothetical protein
MLNVITLNVVAPNFFIGTISDKEKKVLTLTHRANVIKLLTVVVLQIFLIS